MRIHLYDFDGTICKGDTSFQFYIFILKCNPLVLFWLPYQIFFLILRQFRLISDTQVKQSFFVFLPKNNEKIIKLVNDFKTVRKNAIFDQVAKKIKLDKAEKDSVLICISASPRYFLEGLIGDLGFDYFIATEVSAYNYKKIIGKNCRGAEKVLRLKKLFKEKKFDEKNIVSMISDSKFDKPLYDMAAEKYVVDSDGNITEGLPKKWFTF